MAEQTNFYAPPKYSSVEMLNSPFHREAIHLAFGRRQVLPDRHWRYKGPDYFHLMKALYFVRQKHFLSRVFNFFRYKKEAYKSAEIHYIPPSVQMESSTGCALQCPGCLTGKQNASGKPFKVHFTKPVQFKKAIDLIFRKSFQVFFHIHAEPLLNPDFFEACAYAASKGLWTGIHTNFYPTINHLSEKLIDARLCNLVVSIDAATQETYGKYRVGGNLDIVFKKMNDLATLKKQRKVSLPWITAKFLVFEHNWHEIKLFREKAMANGADEVVFVSGYANGIYLSGRPATEFEFNLDTLAWEPIGLPDICPFIWDDLRIDYDGSLMPCGNAYNEGHKFFTYTDPSLDLPISDQLNAEKFLTMRRFFLGGQRPPDFPEPCRNCSIVHRFQENHAVTQT